MAHAELSRDPLDLAKLLEIARGPLHGGVAIFLGDVRAKTGDLTTEALDYEAYEEMAVQEMRRIAGEAEARWGGKIACSHRLGRLGVGETAVIVVAACPHRAEAFEACRFVIDQIKADVPIWKNEA